MIVLLGAGVAIDGTKSKIFSCFARASEDEALSVAGSLRGVEISAAGTSLNGVVRFILNPLLLATGIFALAVCRAYIRQGAMPFVSDLSSGRYALSQWVAYVSLIPLGIAISWLAECALLRKASIALGVVTQRSRMQLAYAFRDAAGGYFGGTSAFHDRRNTDNLVLVFYDPANPDRNSSSSTLAYHRVYVAPANLAARQTAAR